MKQAQTFLISPLLILSVFVAITTTSCTKSATCTNSCMNGGVCVNQNCLCPTGFTGDNCGQPVTSSITYSNDTYTPILIIANGVSDTIHIGSSKTYYGLYGNPLNAYASTSGVINGKIVGDVITWNLSKIFSATGASNYGLDVDSTYFFLQVQNNSTAYPAFGIFVNYATAYQTYDSVAIPNDRNTHNVGYYRAFQKTEIYINADPASSGVFWHTMPFNTSTVFTKNQSYTYSFP